MTEHGNRGGVDAGGEARRKRIGVYHYNSNPFLHGAALKTVTSLAKAGYDVTLIKLAPREDQLRGKRDESKRQLIEGVKLESMELATRKLPRFKGNLLKFAEMFLRYAWHAFRSDYDLYMGFDTPSVLPIFVGTRLKPQKVLYFALELYAEQHWVQGRGLWRKIDRFLCPRVDAIVAVDEYRAKHMVEHYKAITPDTIRNTPPYREVQRGERFAQILQERDSTATKVALYQGYIEAERGVEQLIDAAEHLPDDIAIVMLGGGEPEYLARLDAEIQRRTLGHKVMLHPRVLPHEVWDFTASAHVGLLVHQNISLNFYLNAGATNKLYEYFMAGLPVVAADFPGYPDLVDGEHLGRCVDTTDPRAIAEAIAAVVQDEAAWEAMRARALELAKERFNWEVDGGAFVAVCDRLAARPGRG